MKLVGKIFDPQTLLKRTPPCGEIPTQHDILVKTIHIAWPSILESFLVSLVGVIDTVMVGVLGSYAIAAVGLTTQPKFLGLAIFLSLNIAVSALVAHRKGENDRESANKILVQALIITGIFTVIVSTICVVFANEIIRFSGSSPDTHTYATEYFQIIMGCMVFNVFSMVINAAQRGIGNTRIAMRTNLISNLVNICLNYVLIGGNLGFPKLGVRGAAIATVAGTVVACGMSIYSILHKGYFLSLRETHKIQFDKSTLKSIANIGSSTLAEQVFMRLGFLFYAIIVAKLGTAAFAAHQVGLNILNINFSFGDGISVAAVSLVGQSLGAKRSDLAKIYGSVCQRIGMIFASGIAIIVILLGKQIFALFTSEADVLVYSIPIMQMIIVIVFLQIAQVVFSGCLRGAGDTKFVALVSFVSIAVFRPLSGWLFCYPLGLGLYGAWIGLIIDQFLRFIMTWFRFKSGKWTKYEI